MTREEVIDRLKRIAEKAVHTPGEEPFVMSLDDRIAVHMAISALEQMEKAQSEHNPDDERKIADLHKMVNYLYSRLEQQFIYVDYLISRLKQRWIPCSERLPELNSRCVLLYGNDNISCGYYRGNRTFDVDYGDEDVSTMVIAWMPLPEPWKGEKK